MGDTTKTHANVTARSQTANDAKTEPSVAPSATSTHTESHDAGSPRQDVTNMQGAGEDKEPSPTPGDALKLEGVTRNLERVARYATIMMCPVMGGPALIAARSLGKALEDTAGTYLKDKEKGKQQAEKLAEDLIVSNIPVVGSVMAVRAGAAEVKESVEKGRAASAKGENLEAAGHYVDAGVATLETGVIIVGDVVAHAHAPGKISAKVVEPTTPKVVQSKAGGVPHETPGKLADATTQTGPKVGAEKRSEKGRAGGSWSAPGERPNVTKKDGGQKESGDKGPTGSGTQKTPRGSREYTDDQLKGVNGENWKSERSKHTARADRAANAEAKAVTSKDSKISGEGVEWHHHMDVKTSKELKVSAAIAGERNRLSAVDSRKNPANPSTIGDKTDFRENPARTPHNIAKGIDKDEQTRTAREMGVKGDKPKLPKGSEGRKGLVDASTTSKQIFPKTADRAERAPIPWTRTEPKGPKVNARGEVIGSKAEGYTAKAEAAEKRSEKRSADGPWSGRGERPDVTKKDGDQKGSGDKGSTGSGTQKAPRGSGENTDNQLKDVNGDDWKGDRRKRTTPADRAGERGGEGGHG